MEETATKQDIVNLQAGTKRDLGALQAETKQDIADLRVETKQDIANLGTELRAEMRAMEARIDKKFEDLTLLIGQALNQIQDQFKEVNARFERLEGRVDRIELKLIRMDSKLDAAVRYIHSQEMPVLPRSSAPTPPNFSTIAAMV